MVRSAASSRTLPFVAAGTLTRIGAVRSDESGPTSRSRFHARAVQEVQDQPVFLAVEISADIARSFNFKRTEITSAPFHQVAEQRCVGRLRADEVPAIEVGWDEGHPALSILADNHARLRARLERSVHARYRVRREHLTRRRDLQRDGNTAVRNRTHLFESRERSMTTAWSGQL